MMTMIKARKFAHVSAELEETNYCTERREYALSLQTRNVALYSQPNKVVECIGDRGRCTAVVYLRRSLHSECINSAKLGNVYLRGSLVALWSRRGRNRRRWDDENLPPVR